MLEIKAKFLSGGQRRKLVICMALLGDPKILLCDEIFAALDDAYYTNVKRNFGHSSNEKPQMCIIIWNIRLESYCQLLTVQ